MKTDQPEKPEPSGEEMFRVARIMSDHIGSYPVLGGGILAVITSHTALADAIAVALAEKDEKLGEWKSAHKQCSAAYLELAKERDDLKKKLADKSAECERLNKEIDRLSERIARTEEE